MKHFAFISYVHEYPDASIATSLQKFLCNYELPAFLRKKYPHLPVSGYSIFLDTSHLRTGELWTALQGELAASEYLIVICSRQYLERKLKLKEGEQTWVDQEVEHFCKTHGQDAESRVFPLVLNPGDWMDIIPDSIRRGKISENAVAYSEGEEKRTYCNLLERMFRLEGDSVWKFQRRRDIIRGTGKSTLWTALIGGVMLPTLAAGYLYTQQVDLMAGFQLLQRGILPHHYESSMKRAWQDDHTHVLQLLMDSKSPLLGWNAVYSCMKEAPGFLNAMPSKETVSIVNARLKSLASEEYRGVYAKPEQFRKLLEESVSTGNAELVQKLLLALPTEVAEEEEGYAWSLLRKRELPQRGLLKEYAMIQLAAAGILPAAYGEELRLAAAEGRLRNLRLLLMVGTNPDDTDDSGFFALCRAAQRGHVNCVEELWESGADMHLINRETNRPAIAYAIANEQLDCIRYMIEHGANQNVKCVEDNITESGEALLSAWAIELDKPASLKALLESGVNANSVVSMYDKARPMGDMPAVMLALDLNRPACLKEMLDADMDKSTKWMGHSMMQMAVMCKAADCVQLLAEYGFDVHELDIHGRNLLFLAEDAKTIEVLCKAGVDKEAVFENQTPLAWFVGLGKKELVQALLENGARLDSGIQSGTSPMKWAVVADQKEVARLLLENGADINSADSGGETLLMVAASMNKVEMMKVLLENGADIDAQNAMGNTALMMTIPMGRYEAAQLLISSKCRLDVRNKNGETALQVAVTHGKLRMVEMLGACVREETADGKGGAVLLPAMMNSKPDMLKLLLEMGVNPNDSLDPDGRMFSPEVTPLIYAVLSGQVDKVRELLRHKVDLSLRFKGLTALELARKTGCGEIIDALTQYQKELKDE